MMFYNKNCYFSYNHCQFTSFKGRSQTKKQIANGYPTDTNIAQRNLKISVTECAGIV